MSETYDPEYYYHNRHIKRAIMKKYYDKNKEEIKKKSLGYYEEKKEEVLKRNGEYYKKNSEKISKRNKEKRRLRREEILTKKNKLIEKMEKKLKEILDSNFGEGHCGVESAVEEISKIMEGRPAKEKRKKEVTIFKYDNVY